MFLSGIINGKLRVLKINMSKNVLLDTHVIISLLSEVLTCLLMVFFLSFSSLVCYLQRPSSKYQEKKTGPESPLITSPDISVGIPG